MAFFREDNLDSAHFDKLIEAARTYPAIIRIELVKNGKGRNLFLYHAPIKIGAMTFYGMYAVVTKRMNVELWQDRPEGRYKHPHISDTHMCASENRANISRLFSQGMYLAGLAAITGTFGTYTPEGSYRNYSALHKCKVCGEYGDDEGGKGSFLSRCSHCMETIPHRDCMVEQACYICGSRYMCLDCAEEHKEEHIDIGNGKFTICRRCYGPDAAPHYKVITCKPYDDNREMHEALCNTDSIITCEECGEHVCDNHAKRVVDANMFCIKGYCHPKCIAYVWYSSGVKTLKKSAVLVGTKTCSSCGNFLAPNMFHKDNSSTDGLASQCKRCRRIRREMSRREKEYKEIKKEYKEVKKDG